MALFNSFKISNQLPDQRRRRKSAESCEGQKERLRRQRHRQEVQLEADGAAAGAPRARVSDPRLSRTHAQYQLVR